MSRKLYRPNKKNIKKEDMTIFDRIEVASIVLASVVVVSWSAYSLVDSFRPQPEPVIYEVATNVANTYLGEVNNEVPVSVQKEVEKEQEEQTENTEDNNSASTETTDVTEAEETEDTEEQNTEPVTEMPDETETAANTATEPAEALNTEPVEETEQDLTEPEEPDIENEEAGVAEDDVTNEEFTTDDASVLDESKIIGENEPDAFSVNLTNNTGKEIKEVKISEDESFDDKVNLVQKDDVFEKDEEETLCYLPETNNEDNTSSYNVQLTFDDDTTAVVHTFPFGDIESGEIRLEENVAYLVFDAVSLNKEVNTLESEKSITPPAVQDTEKEAENRKKVYTTKYVLDVHESPSADAKTNGQYKANDVINVLEPETAEHPGWFKVKKMDGGTGYVPMDLVKTEEIDDTSEAEKNGNVIYTARDTLNVRENPDINSRASGRYNEDDVIDVIEPENETHPGWLKVKKMDGGTGYVSAEFVNKTVKD